PKFGFKPLNKTIFIPVNLDLLQQLVDKTGLSEIAFESFVQNGLAQKNDKVKILGRGEIKAKLSVEAHAISGSAKEAIEGAGGSITLVRGGLHCRHHQPRHH
ncbi:MAG: hypothetical protein EBY45_03560, partial [Gammaproteobacteria bacterium]|nr:hypothetical protein [Gammaproteobacteria bacterium]